MKRNARAEQAKSGFLPCKPLSEGGCGMTLPISDFNVRERVRAGGILAKEYPGWCRSCQSVRNADKSARYYADQKAKREQHRKELAIKGFVRNDRDTGPHKGTPEWLFFCAQTCPDADYDRLMEVLG